MINDPQTVETLGDTRPGERHGVVIGGKSSEIAGQTLPLEVEEIHAGGPTELRKEPCPSCGGTERTKALLHPKPEAFRGEWPPQRTLRKDVP